MSERYEITKEVVGILKDLNFSEYINRFYIEIDEHKNVSSELIGGIITVLEQFIEHEEHNLIVEYSIDILKSIITVNNILVTHNGRIRCLLSDIIKNTRFNIDHRMKFKNCCVLLFSITKRYNVLSSSLQLIYEGQVNDEDNYFNSSDINFIFTNRETHGILEELKIKPNDIDGIVNYFIIRHGEGFHNTVGLLGKAAGMFSGQTLDALLSEEGFNQAINAGEFINEYFNVRKIYINNLFCSDLKRTRQTLGYILLKLSKNLLDVQEMIVLPCSHELDPKKGGACDSKQTLFTAPENQITCSIGSMEDNDENCDSLCCFISNGASKIPINWKYYLEFYNGHRRGIKTTIEGICQCSNTSMLSLVLCIISGKNIKNWILSH